MKAAGLDRINVSLDTLRPEVFRKLTHRDRLDDVLAGLAAAASAGLTPVKVNAVVMRDLNEDEPPALLAYCLDHGYELRFIEQMPLDAQHGWKRTEMVTAGEVLASLSAAFELSEDAERSRGAAPAETFLVNGGPARVGVIASVTRPFCGACDRVRLTADGQIRNCLFARSESDLRAALRSGASDDEIAARWRAAVASKLPGHGIDDPSLPPAGPAHVRHRRLRRRFRCRAGCRRWTRRPDGAVIASGMLNSVKLMTPPLAVGSASFISTGVDELVM